MNLTIISGNLTREPEKIDVQGATMCKLVMAVNDHYSKEKNVQYFDVITWGILAENCMKYLAKGSRILVQGKSQTREWVNKNGEKRYAHEIVASEIEFLVTKKPAEVKPVDDPNCPF